MTLTDKESTKDITNIVTDRTGHLIDDSYLVLNRRLMQCCTTDFLHGGWLISIQLYVFIATIKGGN